MLAVDADPSSNLNLLLGLDLDATVSQLREGMLEQGMGNLLKKAISGEGARLSRATGQGKLYVADGGKRITVLELAGESFFVNGKRLNDAPTVENFDKLIEPLLKAG